MNRATRQRGMIHVEGLSHPELESSTTTKPPHSQPTDRYGPSGELPSPTKELKRTSFRFRNLFAAMAIFKKGKSIFIETDSGYEHIVHPSARSVDDEIRIVFKAKVIKNNHAGSGITTERRRIYESSYLHVNLIPPLSPSARICPDWGASAFT